MKIKTYEAIERIRDLFPSLDFIHDEIHDGKCQFLSNNIWEVRDMIALSSNIVNRKIYIYLDIDKGAFFMSSIFEEIVPFYLSCPAEFYVFNSVNETTIKTIYPVAKPNQ